MCACVHVLVSECIYEYISACVSISVSGPVCVYVCVCQYLCSYSADHWSSVFERRERRLEFNAGEQC